MSIRRYISALATTITFLSVASVVNAQVPDPLDPEGYFPLAVGNTWEFKHVLTRPQTVQRPTDESEIRYESYRVTNSSEQGVQTLYTIVYEERSDDQILLSSRIVQIWYDSPSSSIRGDDLPGILGWLNCLDSPFNPIEPIPDGCSPFVSQSDDLVPHLFGTELFLVKVFEFYASGYSVRHGVGVIFGGGGCEPCGPFDDRDDWELMYAKIGENKYGNPVSSGPLVAELSTDKTTYDYGETIVITLKLSNPTSEIVQFHESCPPIFSVDDFELPVVCFAGSDHYYGPGSWRTWEFEMKPAVYGLPTNSGQHSIIGSYYVYADTLTVASPRYIGGRIHLEFLLGTAPEVIEDIRHSLGGLVIDSDVRFNGNLTEIWEINGTSVEDAITQYHSHAAVVQISQTVPPAFYVSVDVENAESIPRDYSLFQNYPNPFNPSTTISYVLSRACDVRLEVFDLLGKRVRILESGLKPNGQHEVTFDATDLGSGIYFYTLTAGDFTQTRKMVVVK